MKEVQPGTADGADLFSSHGRACIIVIDEGNGPLMVLLPSAGRDSEDYDKVAEGLARAGFRILGPQPRGAGKSTGLKDGITLHDLANDVALTIENAQDGQAIIVGHAFGNWVARMTAADHPELVRGVVITAGAFDDFLPKVCWHWLVARKPVDHRFDFAPREPIEGKSGHVRLSNPPWLELRPEGYKQ